MYFCVHVQFICSYVLYPVALFMGTEPGLDCRRVAELVGIKTFTNEFIAYEALQGLLENRRTWNNYTLVHNVSDPINVIYDDLHVNLTQWDVVLVKGFLSVGVLVLLRDSSVWVFLSYEMIPQCGCSCLVKGFLSVGVLVLLRDFTVWVFLSC